MFAGLTGWHVIILSVLGLPQLILWIIALVGIVGSKADAGTTALWIILITIIPIVGPILWLAIGKQSVARGSQPTAPVAAYTSPTPTSPSPAAGWYPSPDHPGLRQWWDGTQWTKRLES